MIEAAAAGVRRAGEPERATYEANGLLDSKGMALGVEMVESPPLDAATCEAVFSETATSWRCSGTGMRGMVGGAGLNGKFTPYRSRLAPRVPEAKGMNSASNLNVADEKSSARFRCGHGNVNNTKRLRGYENKIVK